MGTQLHLLPGNPIPAMCTHSPLTRGFGIVALLALVTCMFSVPMGRAGGGGGSLGLLPSAARKAESQALGPKLPGWLWGDFNIFGRGALSPSPQACSSLLGNLLLNSSEFLPLLRHLHSQLHSGS